MIVTDIVYHVILSRFFVTDIDFHVILSRFFYVILQLFGENAKHFQKGHFDAIKKERTCLTLCEKNAFSVLELSVQFSTLMDKTEDMFAKTQFDLPQ